MKRKATIVVGCQTFVIPQIREIVNNHYRLLVLTSQFDYQSPAVEGTALEVSAEEKRIVAAIEAYYSNDEDLAMQNSEDSIEETLKPCLCCKVVPSILDLEMSAIIAHNPSGNDFSLKCFNCGMEGCYSKTISHNEFNNVTVFRTLLAKEWNKLEGWGVRGCPVTYVKNAEQR